MDERDVLRQRASKVLTDPGRRPPGREAVVARAMRHRSRRRAGAGVGAVFALLLVGAGVVAVARDDAPQVVTAGTGAPTGLIAAPTARGVAIVDSAGGAVATVDEPSDVRALSLSSDGSYLAMATEDGVTVSATSSGESIRDLPGQVVDLAWSPSSNTLAIGTVSASGSGVVIFDASTEATKTLQAPASLTGVAWRHAGSTLLVSGRDESGRAAVFEVPVDGGAPTVLHRAADQQAVIVVGPVDPKGLRAVFWTLPVNSASIEADGAPVSVLDLRTGSATALGFSALLDDQWMAWSPQGDSLLAVSGSGRTLEGKSVTLCHPDGPTCTAVPGAGSGPTFDPSWSPDGLRFSFIAGGDASPSFGRLMIGDLAGSTSEVTGQDAAARPKWLDTGHIVAVTRPGDMFISEIDASTGADISLLHGYRSESIAQGGQDRLLFALHGE